MKERTTAIERVDARAPDETVIARAAAILRDGGLVAFPTETVYGLGANALDADAVARIFTAKGRPTGNPLIVHVADAASAARFASQWPAVAEQLATRFWPGPLTIVVRRTAAIPDVVTGGGETVGLRVPSHPVALALLRQAGLPIAAPSANRSERVSPTRAEHVQRSLGGRIELILDAGPTPGGLESTVVDVTGSDPVVFRPGPISREALEAAAGCPVSYCVPRRIDGVSRSPGMARRHYAPRARLRLCDGDTAELCRSRTRAGRSVGRIVRHPPATPEIEGVRSVVLPADSVAYAAKLYAALHDLDDAGVDEIVVELPPDRPEWFAIRDRLMRAESKSASDG